MAIKKTDAANTEVQAISNFVEPSLEDMIASYEEHLNESKFDLVSVEQAEWQKELVILERYLNDTYYGQTASNKEIAALVESQATTDQGKKDKRNELVANEKEAVYQRFPFIKPGYKTINYSLLKKATAILTGDTDQTVVDGQIKRKLIKLGKEDKPSVVCPQYKEIIAEKRELTGRNRIAQDESPTAQAQQPRSRYRSSGSVVSDAMRETM